MPAFARADVAVTQLGAGWRQSLALTQLNELYAWGRTSAVAATAAAGAGGALLAASGAPPPPGGARGSVNPVTSPIKRAGSKPPIKGRTASDVADDVTSVISTTPMAVAMPTRLWRCPQTLHVESSHSMCAVAVTFAQPSADDVTGSLSSMLFAQQQRSALLDHADALLGGTAPAGGGGGAPASPDGGANGAPGGGSGGTAGLMTGLSLTDFTDRELRTMDSGQLQALQLAAAAEAANSTGGGKGKGEGIAAAAGPTYPGGKTGGAAAAAAAMRRRRHTVVYMSAAQQQLEFLGRGGAAGSAAHKGAYGSSVGSEARLSSAGACGSSCRLSVWFGSFVLCLFLVDPGLRARDMRAASSSTFGSSFRFVGRTVRVKGSAVPSGWYAQTASLADRERGWNTNHASKRDLKYTGASAADGGARGGHGDSKAASEYHQKVRQALPKVRRIVIVYTPSMCGCRSTASVSRAARHQCVTEIASRNQRKSNKN